MTAAGQADHTFRLLATMVQGTAAALPEAWQLYPKVEEARIGAREMMRNHRVLRVAIVGDCIPPRFVEWVVGADVTVMAAQGPGDERATVVRTVNDGSNFERLNLPSRRLWPLRHECDPSRPVHHFSSLGELPRKRPTNAVQPLDDQPTRARHAGYGPHLVSRHLAQGLGRDLGRTLQRA